MVLIGGELVVDPDSTLVPEPWAFGLMAVGLWVRGDEKESAELTAVKSCPE
jgi:hypothetical protein